MQRKLLGIISVDFDTTGQILIYSAFIKYLRRKWEYNEAVHQLFIDSSKPMIQLAERSCIFSFSLVFP